MDFKKSFTTFKNKLSIRLFLWVLIFNVLFTIKKKYETKIKKLNVEIINGFYSKSTRAKYTIKLISKEKIDIISYPDAFFQIITNLINNSIIHGFDNVLNGQIIINIFTNDNKLNIIYSDNGRGINKSIVKNIFDPFFTTKRTEGGTGLGLNIVYNLINQQLNGEIECNSEENNGVEFIISIPISPKGEILYEKK